MINKVIGFALGSVLFVLCVPVEAQQPHKVPRVAYLSGNLAGIPHRVAAFREALRDLGYMEGKNIFIEWRSATRRDRPAVIAELIDLKVDVIVTAGGALARDAKKATSMIPVVFTQDRDPVANGLVASLARPGGNITGMSRRAPELSAKQLELLKEIVPELSHVAIFKSGSRHIAPVLDELKAAAGPLGLKLQYFVVEGTKYIEPAFQQASKARAEAALWLVADNLYNSKRSQVVELAVKSRLPVIYFRRVDVEAGGLLSFGVDFTDLDRRAATYVDKFLKGANPGELPVERPTKFDLVINLKAAKQIGLTFPPLVLYRADKIIK